jgi:hypothetical protein
MCRPQEKGRKSVKKIVVVVLLLFSSLAWAGGEPNPADYTLNAHVSSSHFVEGVTRLNVIIDGKKYELQGPGWILVPGDYKARLAKDDKKNAYDPHFVYELLLPDGKTRQYSVIGISE